MMQNLPPHDDTPDLAAYAALRVRPSHLRRIRAAQARRWYHDLFALAALGFALLFVLSWVFVLWPGSPFSPAPAGAPPESIAADVQATPSPVDTVAPVATSSATATDTVTPSPTTPADTPTETPTMILSTPTPDQLATARAATASAASVAAIVQATLTALAPTNTSPPIDTPTAAPTDTFTPISADTPILMSTGTPAPTATQLVTNTPTPPQIDVQINAPQEPVSLTNTITFELELTNTGAATIKVLELTCNVFGPATPVSGNDWARISDGQYRSAQGNLTPGEGRKISLPLSLSRGVVSATELKVVCDYTVDKLSKQAEASITLQPALVMAFASQRIVTGVEMANAVMLAITDTRTNAFAPGVAVALNITDTTIINAASTNDPAIVVPGEFNTDDNGQIQLSLTGLAVGETIVTAQLVGAESVITLPVRVRPVAEIANSTFDRINVRSQPSIANDNNVLGILKNGTRVQIIGKNSDDKWWLIPFESDGSEVAWITAGTDYVTKYGDTSGVPVVDPANPEALLAALEAQQQTRAGSAAPPTAIAPGTYQLKATDSQDQVSFYRADSPNLTKPVEWAQMPIANNTVIITDKQPVESGVGFVQVQVTLYVTVEYVKPGNGGWVMVNNNSGSRLNDICWGSADTPNESCGMLLPIEPLQLPGQPQVSTGQWYEVTLPTLVKRANLGEKLP